MLIGSKLSNAKFGQQLFPLLLLVNFSSLFALDDQFRCDTFSGDHLNKHSIILVSIYKKVRLVFREINIEQWAKDCMIHKQAFSNH